MEPVYIISDTPRKGRKSVERVDNPNKKSKIDLLINDLGLQNFQKDITTKSMIDLTVDISKANNSHLPKGAERYSYAPTSHYGIIYIPVNRLKQVYQSDEASNTSKIRENVRKMKSGTPLDPIQIGYNYDVHDGHHRWEAAIEVGYTHVPCEVVGSDKEKVAQAKAEYRKLWKSEPSIKNTYMSLVKSLDLDLQNLVLNATDEEDAIKNYEKLLSQVKDDTIRPIIEEILQDEKDHLHNLKQVMKYVKGDEEAISKENMKKSLGGLFLVLDIAKGGQLHRGKLVRKRIPVKGKNGKVFYKMAWIDPNKDKKDMDSSGSSDKEEHSYSHHEDGIKDMERSQSSKFPVRHIGLDRLKNTTRNYTTNQKELAQLIEKYHNGDKLPPIRIKPNGEILDGETLYDMAKKLGLSHVPVVVVGNPQLKKKLEDELREQVYMEEEDDEGNKSEVLVNKQGQREEDPEEGLTEDIIKDVEHFKKFTAKMYTKQYLMEQASKQDIVWAEFKKDGSPLPKNSAILWKNAHQAIVDHIKDGNTFTVAKNEKDIDARMQQDGKDSVHKYFMRVLEKFNGDQDELMEWCRKHGITWKENADPSKNWMTAVMTIKDALSRGRMVNGIRTRQKELIEESNLMVTDQIKSQVKSMGNKYGKANIMDKAEQLGIVFDRFDKKGNELPLNSAIVWMRASEAIQRYIAQGNQFLMGDERDTGIKATVGDHGDIKLSKMQKYAVDWAKRNSQEFESKSRDYCLASIQKDSKATKEESEEMYRKMMENARNAKLMIHLDPLEKLPNGLTLIEQLSSDGQFKNDYYLGRGVDREEREYNEYATFGRDYNDAEDGDRPTYATLDLFRTGLKSNMHAGEIAFIMKEDTKKRATGLYTSGSDVPYGEEGNWVRSLEDPHHLLVDRWYSKWDTPRKADGQRKNAMDAIINGSTYTGDKRYFEAHIHGGVDFKRDIDHLSVPGSWQTDANYKEVHTKLQDFAKLFDISIKYE